MHPMLRTMPATMPCGRDEFDRFLSTPSPAAIRVAGTLDGPVAVLGAGGKMGLHMAAVRRAGDRSVPFWLRRRTETF